MEFELFDAVSFFLYSSILYFLSVISKKLGEAMGMKRYYYLYYLGMLFALSASIMMILSQGDHDDAVYGYYFFATGLTLGLLASIKYWGWLVKELLKGKNQ